MKILKIGNVDIKLDDEDWERLHNYKWNIKKTGLGSYVARTKRIGNKFKTIYMHREIMNASNNMEVHHRNNNPYDNMKENLEELPKIGHSFHHLNQKKGKTTDDTGN